MQAINPIKTHTKFGKDRINTFPSNERKPKHPDDGRRTTEKAKIICPPPSGVDIIRNEISFCIFAPVPHLPCSHYNPVLTRIEG